MAPTSASTRFVALLAAIARSGDRCARPLFVLAICAARHWELLDDSLHTHDGTLFVGDDESTQATTSREVPLAGTARSVLGGDGALTGLLGLPVRSRGRLIEVLRAALDQLEVDDPPELEQVHLVACEALLEAAPDMAHRQAVLAYVGVPAQTVKARRMRADLTPAEFGWVADTLDGFAQVAGIDVERDAHAHQA